MNNRDFTAEWLSARDQLAEALLSIFGISVQDYQTEMADEFMRKHWPQWAPKA